MSASASPRRRHILSSINPDAPERRRKPSRRSPGPRHGSPPPPPTADHPDPSDGEPPSTTRPRPTRLKLKGERRRRRGDDEHDHGHGHGHRHRRRRHHHRSPPPDPHDPPPLDPEAAFRESLFDAMADDEGAAYWESVYGQPVHVYPSTRPGPSGTLEQMTEDEYAAHVRSKMWEKTHAGLLEEQARREQARLRRHAESQRDRKLREDVERSLRRGEERRARRARADRWQRYADAWAAWDGAPERIAWPTAEGDRSSAISEADVREFFVTGLDRDALGQERFVACLRDERVRWHPDKMQQRLGGRRADDEPLMADVTAVFQIIDKLWSEART